MKPLYLWPLLICLYLCSTVSTAQVASAPPEVTNSFAKMFPDASNVQWRNKMTNFSAFFNDKGTKCEAKFTPAGKWISTEESIQWDSLPPLVRDSLRSCKYADWIGTSAYVLTSSDGMTQYHIVVTKDEFGRKLLFFGQNGQLLAEH
jgi:hypothetical protein